jgi:Chromo (CHRromatin Organisation MOdifier) domain
LGTAPKSSNQSVNDLITERQTTVKLLKQQLIKAQERMKKFSDKKRSERKFSVGDWVYLKLQPYRQVFIQGKIGTHKLKPKYYGPFEIFKKIGAVAYKLNLPAGSAIHPVFHVSQLKKCHGQHSNVSGTLPLIGTGGQIRIEPIEILDRRLTKRNNKAVAEVLVRWSNLDTEESTWEEFEYLCKQFPDSKLEDKLKQMGAVLSRSADLIRLETVDSFTFKGGASGEEMGCDADDPNKGINGPLVKVELRVISRPI